MGDFELPRWPAWAYAAAIIVALYAFGNFLAFLALSQGGTPEVQNGIYTLANHGRVIRTLTPEQYHWQQAYVVRGFSGHWLAGQLIPALYFLFRDTPSPEPGSTAPAV